MDNRVGGKQMEIYNLRDMGRDDGRSEVELTLTKAKRYQVTNMVTQQTYQASAFSADEACRKLNWMIGDCHVKEIGVG